MPILKGGNVPEEIKPAKYEEETSKPKPKPKASKDPLMVLRTDLDKVAARIDRLNEVNKVADERFSRLDEKIGELRTGLIEREKEISGLEMKATKAYDMVNLVKPEKLAVDLQKRDAKITSLAASMEANRKLVDSVINEMKELRSKLNVFKGLEGVMKLSSEIREELMGLKKVQARIDVDASKVENMFVEIQKKYVEFSKQEGIISDLKKSFNDLTKQFNLVKVKSAAMADKSELEKVKKEVGENHEIMKSIDREGIKKLTEKVYVTEESLGDINSRIESMSGSMQKLSDYVSGTVINNVDNMKEAIEKTHRYHEGKRKELSETVDGVSGTLEDISKSMDDLRKRVGRVEMVQASPQPRPAQPVEPGAGHGRGDADAARVSDRNIPVLKKYIEGCMIRGFSVNSIKQTLRQAGHTEEDIRRAFSSLD